MDNLGLRTFSFFCTLFSCLVNYVEVIVYRFSSHMCVLCVTKHSKTQQKLVITLLKSQKYS